MGFAKLLLEEADVAVSPGIGFGEYGEGYVRLALVENRQRLRQAVRSIRAFLARHGNGAAEPRHWRWHEQPAARRSGSASPGSVPSGPGPSGCCGTTRSCCAAAPGGALDRHRRQRPRPRAGERGLDLGGRALA